MILTSILTLVVMVCPLKATTFNVDVAPNGDLAFSPSSVTIQAGDTVKWTWKGSPHTVTSGPAGQNTGLFDSGVQNTGFTFSFTFPAAGTFDYHCSLHAVCCRMTGTVIVAAASPTPTPRPPSQAQLLNISTRMNVQTGDNVLIGGFIVTGNAPKKVLLRAIGPSLANGNPPVLGALADPTLELHAADGSLLTSNDNWKDTQQTEIEATGIPPTNDLESALVITLDPGNYTAIVLGKNGTSGIGLVEGYDLDQSADSQLANISTRGFVESGSNVMIGGFILGNGIGTTNVLIRAIGPSLANANPPVPNALADPTLELHDENGALVMSNDNWKDTQQAEIEATGIPPTNDLESAMVVTLPATAHTAIVAGKDGGTGVALVEAYRLP
jgi:plastocyanin